MNSDQKYYAIVSEDNYGPAYGVGLTEADARADALKWGSEASLEGMKCVEITQKQYRRVRSGNPDAWNLD